MGFPLIEYIKIKNNYCICYFGHDTSYIVCLRLVRPFIEKKYPNLKIYLCCEDKYLYLFESEPRVLGKSEIVEKKSNFAFIRELTANNKPPHPVEQLLKESDIEIKSFYPYINDGTCLVCPEAVPPISSGNVELMIKYARKLGFNPIVVGSDVNISIPEIKLRPYGEERLKLLKEAKCVIGVECDLLYLAGFYGAETHLLPTGIGTNFYKMIFNKGKVF